LKSKTRGLALSANPRYLHFQVGDALAEESLRAVEGQDRK
jgi:hypothetical protein